MAVLALMGWRGVDAMAHARDIAQTASQRTLRVSAIVGQWEQDLLALHASPNVPGLAFDGASLRLTRRSEGGVQVVVWSLREGRWRRWAGPVVTQVGALQQSWLRSQQLLGTEPQQLQLLDSVTGWQLYFFRGTGWSNAQSSADVATAPAGAAGATPRELLPGGVRLAIDLPEGRLTRDVMLAPHVP